MKDRRRRNHTGLKIMFQISAMAQKKIARLFGSKEQLIQWLYKEFEDEDYEIGTRSISKSLVTITSVRKSEKFWWVEGYANLESGVFPDWRDIVAKYHGEV